MDLIYILDINGNPLMPTKRYKHIRNLLKNKKAYIKYLKPFTVQLKYVPDTHIVQNLTLGIDTGRVNIGIGVSDDNGKNLIRCELETRNKEIKKLMSNRTAHRRASRSGERKARQRLAKKFNTMFKSSCKLRKLPQCEVEIKCNLITNTETRFCNRKRPAGWLTPSAEQLYRTHINFIKKITKILPIKYIAIENVKFDIAKISDPSIYGFKYQQGILKGFRDVNEFIYTQQEGKCLLCESKINHYHHIVPKSKCGSESANNIAGLCDKCHDKVHKLIISEKELKSIKSGLIKQFDSLSIMNQIMPKLIKELTNMFGEENIFITSGFNTKQIRDELGLDKEHDIDGYCIALNSILSRTGKGTDDLHIELNNYYKLKQFRRHDRAIIKAQTERIYYLDNKKVATNRKKRTEQKINSLEEWYKETRNKYGKEKARTLQKQLVVSKSQRRYNKLDRLMPGTEFMYNKKRLIMSGSLTNGQYLRAVGDTKTNYNIKKVKIINKNRGIVFI